MRDSNTLHPSCATAPAPDSPMEVGDNLELEEITLVRGAHDHLLERGDQQSRRDRDRRGENRGDRGDRRDRGMHRQRDERRHRDRDHRPRRSNNPHRN